MQKRIAGSQRDPLRNKTRDMKTEPTEAYEAIEYYEANNINIDAFRAKKLCDMAFYEGQSSLETNCMMKVEQIRTADDVERYIDGCLNDYEAGVSTKDETVVNLVELVAHVYMKATEEKRIITIKQHRG